MHFKGWRGALADHPVRVPDRAPTLLRLLVRLQ